jgi:hypothetical protein
VPQRAVPGRLATFPSVSLVHLPLPGLSFCPETFRTFAKRFGHRRPLAACIIRLGVQSSCTLPVGRGAYHDGGDVPIPLSTMETPNRNG